MSSSDGNSTTHPLRRRKSKRFDRSGGSPRVTGSTMMDDDAAEPGAVEPLIEDSSDAVAITAAPESDRGPAAEADGAPEPTAEDGGDTAPEEPEDRRTDQAARNRTLDQLPLCGRCGYDVSTITIEVDGNVLLMESCDNCDTRRWQLAGEPVELQKALDHVGEHSGRRR